MGRIFRKKIGKVTYGTVGEAEITRKCRKMPTKVENSMITESAIWRSDIENLCNEFDSRESCAKNGPEREILRNVRQKAQMYREQLSELKIEAKVLKRQRNQLFVAVNYASLPDN